MARSHSHQSVAPESGCVGRIRRVYVRGGVGQYYVAIGWVCDGCGMTELDVDRHVRMAAVKQLPADRALLRRMRARNRVRRERERERA